MYHFIHKTMQIRGRILLLRAIVQCHVDLIERKLGRTKKIDISGCNGPNKSLKMGKFSLSQASVNWKIVTFALHILGLFLQLLHDHLYRDRLR